MSSYELSIDNYINDEYSICREERQYALYLSNILRYYGKNERIKALEGDLKTFLVKIYYLCGLIKDSKEIPDKLVIKDVFYEATFMRDFLERNRRLKLANKNDLTSEKTAKKCLQKSYTPQKDGKTDYTVNSITEDSFNYKLLEYVTRAFPEENVRLENIKDITERNYGHNAIPDGLTDKQKLRLVSMMNAKPDLVVIYSQDGKDYFSFIECKFESDEDKYGDGFGQTEVQWHIANFLKEFLWKTNGKEIELSESMKKEEDKNKGAILVRFGRDEYDPKAVVPRESGETTLEIDKLIELEKTIFAVKEIP
jgi:hypothetical protein